jgi:hypothetical protein
MNIVQLIFDIGVLGFLWTLNVKLNVILDSNKETGA